MNFLPSAAKACILYKYIERNKKRARSSLWIDFPAPVRKSRSFKSCRHSSIDLPDCHAKFTCNICGFATQNRRLLGRLSPAAGNDIEGASFLFSNPGYVCRAHKEGSAGVCAAADPSHVSICPQRGAVCLSFIVAVLRKHGKRRKKSAGENDRNERTFSTKAVDRAREEIVASGLFNNSGPWQ